MNSHNFGNTIDKVDKAIHQYTPVDIALTEFLSACADKLSLSPGIDHVNLFESYNRVLATDFTSCIDIPSFTRAAMDGYAIISSDTKAASEDNPIILDVIGRVNAGEKSQYRVRSGTCIAVATGAKVPLDADAVVMIENTSPSKERNDDGNLNNKVEIYKEINSGKNIAYKGEDIRKGQTLLNQGTLITSQDIGLIASVGLSKIPVFSKPLVSVFSTGNEIIEPDLPGRLPLLGPDETKVFDCNRYMLSSMIMNCGCNAIDLGICADDRYAIEKRLKEALKYDVVVLSGGSSVGEEDFVPDIINRIGKPGVVVHKVAMRPGSPTALAVVNGKPILSLPGYPVSAFFAFYMFARPLLFKILRIREHLPENKLIAKMTSDVMIDKNMLTFIRVKLVPRINSDNSDDDSSDCHYLADPISKSGAGILSTLTNADGIVLIEGDKKGTILTKDQIVEVIPLRNIR